MVRPKSQTLDLSAYTPAYRLLEEARKSQHYVVCDKLVYSLDIRKVALDFPIQVAKHYLKVGNPWIECHLTFERERNFHYHMIIELLEEAVLRMESSTSVPDRTATNPTNGNSYVLVNVVQSVQPPQKMLPDSLRRRCIVRLKRFDYCCCF